MPCCSSALLSIPCTPLAQTLCLPLGREHTHTHTNTHTRIHTHAHTHAYTHMHTHTHTNTLTRTHTQTHTCTRTHTRTHIWNMEHMHCKGASEYTYGKLWVSLQVSLTPMSDSNVFFFFSACCYLPMTICVTLYFAVLLVSGCDSSQ